MKSLINKIKITDLIRVVATKKNCFWINEYTYKVRVNDGRRGSASDGVLLFKKDVQSYARTVLRDRLRRIKSTHENYNVQGTFNDFLRSRGLSSQQYKQACELVTEKQS